MRSLATILVILLAGLAPTIGVAAGPCFKPLSDPASHNPTDWIEFTNRVPAEPAASVTKIQLVSAGTGNVNLDYYGLTFKKPGDGSLQKTFKDLRLKFGEFARGKSEEQDFFPYKYPDKQSEKEKANLKLWESDDPLKAHLSFLLKKVVSFTLKGNSLSVYKKKGDVQVVCASPTDFIFSTAESEGSSMHPVSGNRGFGIKDNGDGTWTFYSQAADRDSGMLQNYFLAAQLTNVFEKGHEFWISFYGNMGDYLRRTSMPPVGELYFNSCRYPFPFTNPPQYVECTKAD